MKRILRLLPVVYHFSTAGADGVTVLWIDAVRLLVDDLDVAAADLAVTHGLAVADLAGPGGPARVVPVGPAFLEFVIADDNAPMWSVATDEFDSTVRRLRRAWETVTWRYPGGASAGCRVMVPEDRCLPAIVDWGAALHPSRCPVPHRTIPLGISCVSVGCDSEALGAWLGPDVVDLPIRHADGGTRVVHSVDLALADARVILRGSGQHDDEYAV